jgi:hypothetical protein
LGLGKTSVLVFCRGNGGFGGVPFLRREGTLSFHEERSGKVWHDVAVRSVSEKKGFSFNLLPSLSVTHAMSVKCEFDLSFMVDQAMRGNLLFLFD